jgi:hypothetical protein
MRFCVRPGGAAIGFPAINKGGIAMETINVLRSLTELEDVIQSGLKTFVEVGAALLEIRDRRLYQKQGFDTFENYCRERWGWGRNYVNKQIAAAGVVQALGTNVPTPKTEAQARELVGLTVDEQREVASELNFHTATAKDVRVAVKRRGARPALSAPKRTPAQIALELAAMPQPVTPQQACARFNWSPGTISKRIYELRSIPWARVKKAQAPGRLAYHVTINHEMKTACENERPLRSGGEPPRDFCRRLLAELLRRRKEIKDKNSKGRWLPENVSLIELTVMLDWVQGELETFNDGASALGRDKAARLPRQRQGETHDTQDQLTTRSAN